MVFKALVMSAVCVVNSSALFCMDAPRTPDRRIPVPVEAPNPQELRKLMDLARQLDSARSAGHDARVQVIGGALVQGLHNYNTRYHQEVLLSELTALVLDNSPSLLAGFPHGDDTDTDVENIGGDDDFGGVCIFE